MKKYYKKLVLPFAIISIGLGIASCKKYLDQSPEASISNAQAFKNFRNFQGFTEELYNCVPVITAIGSHNNWNFGEDEYWQPNENRMMAYSIDRGDYRTWENQVFGSWFKNGGNASNNDRTQKGNLYGLSWYGIRKANIGLANLELLTDATQEEKNLIAGQLYFFRGWFHFMLMQYWGGLPYIDVVLPPDQSPRLPRLNYQQTAEKVAEDLRRAADLLPVDWDQTQAGRTTLGNNDRRINKIMSLAFLGKNLLLAGSPLMNEESTGSTTYNADLCKRAADVFAETLQLVESTKRYELVPFANYSQLFYNPNNGPIPGSVIINGRRVYEAIFMENPLDAQANRFRWNQINDYRPPTLIPSGLKAYPTANYVNYYGMKNGLPITDPESGFNPEYPWRDRDPRFYHDIMFDGEKAVSNAGLVGNNELRQYASLYTGGLYRTQDPTQAVFTGYMLSKFFPRIVNDWESTRENNVVVLSLLRLADVYLMYAEAVSEGYNNPRHTVAGYSKSAVEAINFVRNRAGVEPIADKFVGSSDAFRGEYRRERAVELAFEGHRFIDLRRWKLLDKSPYTLKTAVEFDRATPNAQVYANPQNARVANFREKVLFTRNFTSRHYWFPFPTSDVNIYEGFPQNPGW